MESNRITIELTTMTTVFGLAHSLSRLCWDYLTCSHQPYSFRQSLYRHGKLHTHTYEIQEGGNLKAIVMSAWNEQYDLMEEDKKAQ